jgi:hypothetical protein
MMPPVINQDAVSTCGLCGWEGFDTDAKVMRSRLLAHLIEAHAPAHACEHCRREGYDRERSPYDLWRMRAIVSDMVPSKGWLIDRDVVNQGTAGKYPVFFCAPCGVYAGV